MTVEDRLLERMDSLTRAERQLATELLDDYPVSGLASITELARRAGVSTPTVVRTARKLGFDGFVDMQRAIRDEASQRIRDPLDRHAGWAGGMDEEHLITRYADAAAANLRNTLQRISAEDFETVVNMLADTERSLYLTGGRITRSLADLLFNHLQIIRPGVTHLGTSANIWPQYVVDMDETSVLLLFDIRRYETDIAKLARLADERGATIVLFTDQWGSPINRLATHRFDALVEVPSAWDSTLAIQLLVEMLIAAVQDQLWQSSKSRIETLETMFGKTRLFRRFQ